QQAGAAAIVPGRDPEIWGEAINAYFEKGVAPFSGSAIVAELEPQRIAAMLLELAREVVSVPV
ncbi:MAG: hypothetical protein MUP61_01185, partial [Burkholderiales bacterium]|nr:hypothetical protein [Burkholderiales bacterium]